MQESIQLVIDSLPFLLKGAVFTLQLSIGGMFFGLVLGFVLALMRMSPVWPVRWLARFYISVFRGTPLHALRHSTSFFMASVRATFALPVPANTSLHRTGSWSSSSGK